MSDPRYTDPRLDPVAPESEQRASNSMWAWTAGVVVVGLIALFLLSAGDNNSQQASNPNAPATSAQTTPSASPSPASPPSTTGQGSSEPVNPAPSNPTASPPSPAPSGNSGSGSQ